MFIGNPKNHKIIDAKLTRRIKVAQIAQNCQNSLQFSFNKSWKMHRNIKRNLPGEFWNGIYPSGSFQSFIMPKKILAVYKSIRKIEFDCEMKMHCNQIYDDDELNKKLYFPLRPNLMKHFWSPILLILVYLYFLNWSPNTTANLAAINVLVKLHAIE